MTTTDAAGVCRTDAASVAANARPACHADPCPDRDAAHHRARGTVKRNAAPVSAETRVYLCVSYVNQQREGFAPDIDNYLDNHFGAHIVTGQFEPDHLWIAPLYVKACEIRVPVRAVWVAR